MTEMVQRLIIDVAVPMAGAFIGTILGLESWKHRHHWHISGASYTPPSQGSWRIQTEDMDGAERLQKRQLQGVTTIYLRCVGCGQIEQKEVFGEFRPGSVPTDDELTALRKMAGIG